MSKKHKFRGTIQRREHYDRKVRKVGHTISISVGKFIPSDWGYVRITPLNRTPTSIEVLFEKLLGRNNNAQTTATRKGHKQNT